ncbi:hypothetical protein U9M48_027517 [Paspalum notatum var. saurae]|uniref:Uncharacterized protein n=1 Tax=Paspalum notatum var. saurae TaxID=547442 RepID=A0AAQ3TVB6_PASNO
MGNCLSPDSKRRGQHGALLPEEEEESLSEMRRISQLLREEEYEEDDYDDARPPPAEQAEEAAAAAAAPPAAVKVKIVLTRGELEWLMAQLKSGDQRLDDVLQHVQAHQAALNSGKPAAGGWRPRLESIVECPDPEIATTTTTTTAFVS